MHKWLILLLCVFTVCSCSSLRPLRYGGVPTQKSYKRFPSRIVENQTPIFKFQKARKDYGLGVKVGLLSSDYNATNINLDSLVQLHNTVAFIIIRNDTILYEKYQKKFTDTSLVSSFSLVKPIISTLIGIALDEGKINDIEDYIVDYLPQYQKRKGWDKIKIRHLLHHTSGIAFSDNKLNPFSDNAQFYWGIDLRRRLDAAKIEHLPDTQFKYSSINIMLLALIIERVTNKSLAFYLQEKIWKPLGMESPAYWSLDRNDEQAIEKAFCCLQARAIDFAKFARLNLYYGNWEGKQIVSKDWVSQSTKPHPEGNNKHFYHNNWGIGPLKYGSFYAIGLYGQYLYIYPEKNIIIVRFANDTTFLHTGYWNELFLQIIDQL